MKDLNKRNSKQTVAVRNERENNMILTTLQRPKEKNLGTLHQQNLIELFTHIYFNSNKHTYYSLAKEMSKGKRAIQRMIIDINLLYPCIQTSVNNIDGCVHLAVKNKISEFALDNAYQSKQNAPILYVFLKSLLKPVSVDEIIEKVGVNKKSAEKIVEKIFEATPYGDFIGFDEE